MKIENPHEKDGILGLVWLDGYEKGYLEASKFAQEAIKEGFSKQEIQKMIKKAIDIKQKKIFPSLSK